MLDKILVPDDLPETFVKTSTYQEDDEGFNDEPPEQDLLRKPIDFQKVG